MLLRLGTDEEIQLHVNKSDNLQEAVVIQNFTWDQLYKYKLLESRYTYYCRCISAVMVLAVKRDAKVTPDLKNIIQKYIESGIADSGLWATDLFETYVWGLLYIEGEPAFVWLKKTFDRNTSFPLALKNRIVTNAQYILWIDKNENCQEHEDIPNFLYALQVNINIYDPDWIIRFYCQYCKFYNTPPFRNFDDWYEHFQQQKNAIAKPSYEDAMFFKSWYILINIICKNKSNASTINLSRNMLKFGDYSHVLHDCKTN
jgi:hypothetical protein